MNIATISTYVKNHERLVLSVIAGLVLWFTIGKIDTLIANHDHANLQQAQVVAAVQQEKNEETAKLVAQQAADMKVLNDKVQAQNAALEQANLALVTALTKQQKIDATMSTPEVAQRWMQLVPASTVKPTPSGVTLDDASAHATVSELEKAPVLTKQLEASHEELTNAQLLLSVSGQQVTTLNTQVTGLQLKSVDDAKVCAAQIAVVKADARKSKRKWAVVGAITGFIMRQVVKSTIGI